MLTKICEKKKETETEGKNEKEKQEGREGDGGREAVREEEKHRKDTTRYY